MITMVVLELHEGLLQGTRFGGCFLRQGCIGHIARKKAHVVVWNVRTPLTQKYVSGGETVERDTLVAKVSIDTTDAMKALTELKNQAEETLASLEAVIRAKAEL